MTLLIELLSIDGHVISDAAVIASVANALESNIAFRRVKTEVVAGSPWDREPEAMESKVDSTRQVSIDCSATDQGPGPL